MSKNLYLRRTALVEANGLAVIPLPPEDTAQIAFVLEHKGSALRLYYAMEHEQVIEFLTALFDVLDEETAQRLHEELVGEWNASSR